MTFSSLVERWGMPLPPQSRWLLRPGPALPDGLDDIVKAGVMRVAVPQGFTSFGSADTVMKEVVRPWTLLG